GPALAAPVGAPRLRRQRAGGLLREPAGRDLPDRLRHPHRTAAGRPQGPGRAPHASAHRGRPPGHGPARARGGRARAGPRGPESLTMRESIDQHTFEISPLPRRTSGASLKPFFTRSHVMSMRNPLAVAALAAPFVLVACGGGEKTEAPAA